MSSRIVLITGANSGFGLSAAQVIASASPDFHVIMTGRSLEKVNNAKSEIVKSPSIKGTLSAVQLDVTDEDSILQAKKHVEQEHGRLDVLINNAGVGGIHFPDIKTRMQKCMDTNVIGPAVVADAFRPLLLKAPNPYSIYVTSGGGSLSKTASAQGPHTLPHEEAYRASKAALNMLMVVEARDYGPKGLKVFSMTPGFVISNLRGTTEEERNGWGGAKDPQASGEFLLSLIQGERDADVGKVLRIEGIEPW